MTYTNHRHNLLLLGVAGALGSGACGGNYSSTDLDFQAALPEQSALSTKMPQALTIADSSEYFKWTREVATVFNGALNGFLGIVDFVRAHPPTQRHESRRIWGPFPADKQPGWRVRMVMDRVEDPMVELYGYRFDYHLDVSPVGSADDAWIVLMKGSFEPSGGARRGKGWLDFDTRDARAASFPLDDPADLERLRVVYETKESKPIIVDMEITNVPSKGGMATIHYREELDRSGDLQFEFANDGNVLEVHSRWNDAGAGRADVKLKNQGDVGIDCWGPDTRPTYVHRDWPIPSSAGDPLTCAF